MKEFAKELKEKLNGYGSNDSTITIGLLKSILDEIINENPYRTNEK